MNYPQLSATSILLLAALVSPLLQAETAEEKGLAIATEADRRDSGFGDSSVELVMTLRNRQGEESVRNVRTQVLEVTGDGDKSMTIFDHPADIKGTAMLTFSHALEPDEQWLYLPALKRVKRISSRNKSGPFMGSEFAYEDLSSQEIPKYSYRWLRDEEVLGRNCFVVERTPRYENSGYTRQLAWIDQERYIALKIDFYDRKESLLKTLEMSDYQQYLDQYWRADRFEMVNHQNGKSTTLEFRDYQFGSGLSDADFNKNSLKRAR
ncbi:MAG: outer membrane lipoprotein-sorting protein [Gammaproteobacteria bacterium]|nr:outer membrane lipoprotein-sorting protein [Gammaproteobacteria bacterium]